MIIDTSKKTVKFSEGEVVDLGVLTALVALFSDDQPGTDPEPDPSTVVIAEYATQSDSEHRKWYTVKQFKDNHFTCDCPDYVIRRSKDGGKCKHIIRVHYRSL